MASRPENPDIFMAEVDDAVRADRAATFMARYGMLLAGLVIVGLIGFGGWLLWQDRQDAAAAQSGRSYSAALEAMGTGRPKAASDQAALLVTSDDATYRALALMLQGNAALAQGDASTAAARFGAAANDAEVPTALRNVALLRQTLTEFDTLPPETVVARLRALVATPGPAFASAAELTALAELKRGNDRAAGLLFKRIAETEDVAEGLQTRARQMAATLGVDAVPAGAPAAAATPAANATPPAATPAAATKTGE